MRVGVPGSARGSSAGLGSHPGQPSPAALHARAGNFLTGSCRLAGKGAPLRSAPWASPAVPTDPSLSASPLDICMFPLLHRCGKAPPGGCPENPGVRVPSNQHRPGVPQVWNFIAAGWVTRLHTWPGWGGLSAISAPSPECWEVHCRLGHVDGLYIQDSRGGFTLKE